MEYSLRKPVIRKSGYEIPRTIEFADTMDDSGSDFDSDDSFESLTDFTTIDVNGALGKSIAVWTYQRPENLVLFTPSPLDTLFRVIKYAETEMGFHRKEEKIMVLAAGEKTLKDVREIYAVKPGCVVMVLPRLHFNITIEINQLKTKLPMNADPLSTVYNAKAYIKRVKGIPIEQQDLLFRDKALENGRRIYEYKIRDGSKLHLLIQVTFGLLINIKTFWGKTYSLYVDTCTTGTDVIYTIFGRTFSKYGPDQITVHELYVPVHVLVLRYHRKSLNWDHCLGYFGVRNGDTLSITTVGSESGLNMQVLKVITESGEKHDVMVSQLERWSVVAFILHGKTDVPIDLIRLYVDRVQVDFTSVIGEVNKKSTILMNVFVTELNKDLMLGVPLKIGLGNGIVESFRMMATKKVKSVKAHLEKMGVPNASLYELVIGDFKLPNQRQLQDIVYDLNAPMFLKIEKFPIFVHSPDGVIYKTNVFVHQTFSDLKDKLELKSGLNMNNCRFLMAGQEFKEPNSAILLDCGITTRSSIFVESKGVLDTFFITKGTLLIKLKIPMKPKPADIKKHIWENRDVPEGSITCLQTFLFWFYNTRSNKRYHVSKRRDVRKTLPFSHPLIMAVDRHQLKFPIQYNLGKHPSQHSLDSKGEELKNHKLSYLQRGRPALRFQAFKQKDRPDPKLENVTTWPPANEHRQYQPRPERDVESWVQGGHYDIDQILFSHPRVLINNPPQDHRQSHPRRPEKIEVIHYTPRWLNNLYQKYDENRLVVTDDDVGAGYRHHKKPKYQYAFAEEKKRDTGLARKEFIQGDASGGKFPHRRLAYDKQLFPYVNTDYNESSQSTPRTPRSLRSRSDL